MCRKSIPKSLLTAKKLTCRNYLCCRNWSRKGNGSKRFTKWLLRGQPIQAVMGWWWIGIRRVEQYAVYPILLSESDPDLPTKINLDLGQQYHWCRSELTLCSCRGFSMWSEEIQLVSVWKKMCIHHRPIAIISILNP